MGRTARDNRPNLKPVKKIELSEKNTTWRFVLLVLLLLVAAVSFTVFLTSLLNKDKGWNVITPSENENIYQGEIQLNYDLGKGDVGATAEYKAIQSLYTEKLSLAYKTFSSQSDFDGIVNIKTLSTSPNSDIDTSPLLYQTLKTMTANGNRILYYAPIFSLYSNVFYSEDDVIAKEQDPNWNYELREDINRLLPYVMSEEHIKVEFLNDEKYTLRLFVSEDYLAVLSDLFIEDKISLGIFEMAFVVDYIADTLILSDYTDGLVSSYNGYSRNLGMYDQKLTASINEKMENRTFQTVANLSYSGSLSMVSYRNYPLFELDRLNFYLYEDGSLVSPFINLYTGLNDTLALDDMVFYSRNVSCATLALSTYPFFANASLMGNDINDLTSQGIYCVYTVDKTVFYNEALLFSDDNLKIIVTGYNKSYLMA